MAIAIEAYRRGARLIRAVRAGICPLLLFSACGPEYRRELQVATSPNGELVASVVQVSQSVSSGQNEVWIGESGKGGPERIAWSRYDSWLVVIWESNRVLRIEPRIGQKNTIVRDCRHRVVINGHDVSVVLDPGIVEVK